MIESQVEVEDEDTLAKEDHTNDYNERIKEDFEVVIQIMDMDTTDIVNNSELDDTDMSSILIKTN